MPANNGVTDLRPTVAKLLTVAPVATEQTTTQSISVPLGILERVIVYIPPGCNYSVGVGVGFNTKKLIPTEGSTDFIYGPNFPHEYAAGWQVNNAVEVFFRQRNLLQHRIYVALYISRLDLVSSSGMVLPR